MGNKLPKLTSDRNGVKITVDALVRYKRTEGGNLVTGRVIRHSASGRWLIKPINKSLSGNDLMSASAIEVIGGKR